jgi:hypothetical protein
MGKLRQENREMSEQLTSDQMSVEEALLLASVSTDEQNPYVEALKLLGREYYKSSITIIRQANELRKLQQREGV